MRLALYLLFSTLYASSIAQNKIFLCTNYNNDGTYTGAFENWDIQKGGNFMYLFYKSEVQIKDTVFITIDKIFNRKDTNYYEFDHYYLNTGSSNNWAANKYTFTKSGNYKIEVHDRYYNKLAEPYFTSINLAETEYADMYFRDTWYYKQSEITFFEKVVNDSLYNQKNIFSFEPLGNKIILYIGQQNKKPLSTNHLFVTVYSADKCRELMHSYSYYVDEKWFWTHIPVYIKQKGKFIVEVHNDDDVFINSATLEIK